MSDSRLADLLLIKKKQTIIHFYNSLHQQADEDTLTLSAVPHGPLPGHFLLHHIKLIRGIWPLLMHIFSASNKVVSSEVSIWIAANLQALVRMSAPMTIFSVLLLLTGGMRLSFLSSVTWIELIKEETQLMTWIINISMYNPSTTWCGSWIINTMIKQFCMSILIFVSAKQISRWTCKIVLWWISVSELLFLLWRTNKSYLPAYLGSLQRLI